MAMAFADQLIVGNVGRVYELRQTGNDNNSVVDATVAVTPRKKVNGEWTDGTTYWARITFWGSLAENVAAHWKPGDNVMAYCRVEMKPEFTKPDGTVLPERMHLVAKNAGHEESRYGATQHRERKDNGGEGQAPRQQRPQQQRQQQAAPAAAPKAAPKADPLDDLNFGDDDMSFLDDNSPF